MLKIWSPNPALKVPEFVMPPLNMTLELPELFHVDVAPIVTSPTKVFAPTPDVSAKVAPPGPTLVEPLVVKGNPPIDNEELTATFSAPETETATDVDVFEPPVTERLLNVVDVEPPID